jgi:hypothetical protein
MQTEKEYMEQAKQIFNKSFNKEPNLEKDFVLINSISQKIKQGRESYHEGFIDEMKVFFMKHLNNPILTLLIVKYISSLLGRQSYSSKIKSLKEKLIGDNNESNI